MSTKSSPINVQIVGLGRAGWDIHIKQLQHDPRYHISAVCDSSPERRQEAETLLNCQSFSDFATMLKNSTAELIVIATPSFMHHEQTITSLKSGRNVIIEKPMALTTPDADDMIATAKTAGKLLIPFQPRRFTRQFTFLHEVLNSGKLGKLFHLSMTDHCYTRRNDWQCLLSCGGGLLTNHGAHCLDLIMNLLLGDSIKNSMCSLARKAAAGDAEDHVKILMRTEKGISVDVEISNAAAVTRTGIRWTLLGDCGSCVIENNQAEIRYYDPKQVQPVKITEGMSAPGRIYGNPEELPWQQTNRKAEGPEPKPFYDQVYAALREGGALPTNPTEVREVIKLIESSRSQNPEFVRQSNAQTKLHS